MEIKQYSVHWINLDPTQGSEVNKTHLCVILSPNEMNQYIRTVIIAPLTHTLKNYPTRVACNINGEEGAVMLDQIRTVDKARIGNRLGTLNVAEITTIKQVIYQMLC